MPQTLVVLFSIALVVLCTLAVRHHGRTSWRPFFIGAAVMVVASSLGSFIGGFIGGLIGGFIRIGLPHALSGAPELLRVLGKLTAWSILLFTAASEDVGRAIALWRRPMPISEALMFGTGFGGIEVLFRAGKILVAGSASGLDSNTIAALCTIVMVGEVFVFHVAMTVIVASEYRRGTRFFPVMIVAVSYHVGLDFVGVRLAMTDPSLVHEAIFWTAITPVHTLLAWQAARGGGRYNNAVSFGSG